MRWSGPLLIVFAPALGCDQKPPPGAQDPQPIAQELAPRQVSSAATPAGRPELMGGRDDNLPFDATGEYLASIAWRTWVYTDVGSNRTRYGYLRAGAVVERRGPAVVNDGCRGGWYRINPRGYVCIGKGATLDLQHPVVLASHTRAERGQGLPYLYTLSRDKPPYLFFQLPSAAVMRRLEGDFHRRAQTWLGARKARSELPLLRLGDVPAVLAKGEPLEKPYGVERPLRTQFHAGLAEPDGGFAVAETFRWEERVFGLTTELDVIALDRTKLVVPSQFKGLALGPEGDLPVGITQLPWVAELELDETTGGLHPNGALPKRTVIDLSGDIRRIGAARFYRTRSGTYVASRGLLVVEKRERFPSIATGSRKWIDIAIKTQTLVAYEGQKAVFATLISSGAGGLGDPEKVPATAQGTFMIHAKHVSSTMDGDDDKSDSFNLRDVPFVQYFHKGYALHAAYWHDDFGRYRSHGCINLAPADAAWLFEWTDPYVPASWHAVLNKERGTVVHIHP